MSLYDPPRPDAKQLISALHNLGVPVKMLWFCGGHGICLTNQGDPNYTTDATVAWLNRWVKRDPTVKTGSTVNVIDQDGHRYDAANYPLPTASSLRGQGSGSREGARG